MVSKPSAEADASINSKPSAKSSPSNVTAKEPETVRVFGGKETTHRPAVVKSLPQVAVPLASDKTISVASVKRVTPGAKPTS